jgi:hypothetical protein
MRKYLVGIGTILCLIAFFAFGVNTRIAGKANAKPATKIAAIPASSAGSGLMIQSGDKNVALATTKSAATAATAPKPGIKPDTKSKQSNVVLQEYAKLPLSFEPNLGQANSDAKFLARGDGYSLFLNSDQAVLAMKGHSTKSAKSASSSNALGVLRMKLDGTRTFPPTAKSPRKMCMRESISFTTARSANWNTTSTWRRERTRRRFKLLLMARAS